MYDGTLIHYNNKNNTKKTYLTVSFDEYHIMEITLLCKFGLGGGVWRGGG